MVQNFTKQRPGGEIDENILLAIIPAIWYNNYNSYYYCVNECTRVCVNIILKKTSTCTQVISFTNSL